MNAFHTTAKIHNTSQRIGKIGFGVNMIREMIFSKTSSHVFPAVSKEGYTDYYLGA